MSTSNKQIDNKALKWTKCHALLAASLTVFASISFCDVDSYAAGDSRSQAVWYTNDEDAPERDNDSHSDEGASANDDSHSARDSHSGESADHDGESADHEGTNATYVPDTESMSRFEKWMSKRPPRSRWVSEDVPLTQNEVDKFDKMLVDNVLVLTQNLESTMYESGSDLDSISPSVFVYMKAFNKDARIEYFTSTDNQVEVDWNKPEYAPTDKNIELLSDKDKTELETAQEFVGDLFEVKAYANVKVNNLHHSYDLRVSDLEKPDYLNPNIGISKIGSLTNDFDSRWAVSFKFKQRMHPQGTHLTIDVSDCALGLMVDVYTWDKDRNTYVLLDTKRPVKDGYVEIALPSKSVREIVLVGDVIDSTKQFQEYYSYI